jgi:N6-L-threonylcarbamoyladenine synthase
MLTLGIETSCDETALALVRDGRVLGQELASQADLHSLFGGVVPELASREHYRLLQPLYARLTAAAGVSGADLDVVAVSRGPGLLGALLVGLAFAKGLAMATGAALVGVNHLHAHLLAPGLEEDLRFPAVGLLVSGGHSQLYAVRGETEFELLGRTLDDAAGEAYDKVAKVLNLPYPGGSCIDRLAAAGQADPGLFPRPYIDNQNMDFSFSGLKTAVGVYLQSRPHLRLADLEQARAVLEHPEDAGELADLCASFNHSVADALRIKTERALAAVPEARSLIVAGGVACNSRLRQVMRELAQRRGLALHLPRPGLCTDNAVMVAWCGERLARAGLRHSLDMDAVPRGKPVPWDFVEAHSQG